MTFALLALASTAAVSFVTYGLARTYVLDQRDRLATSQAFSNARLAKNLLRTGDPAPEQVVDAIRGEAGTQVLLRFGGEWYTSAVSLSADDLPPSMTTIVETGSAARQRFSNRGVTNLAVGVPIPAAGAVYYEVSPLVELRRTLGILSTSLVVASVITTLLGATAGLIVAHRLLRPLRRMSDASVDIADGELTRRLDAEGDADLEPLVDSFNQMADAIQLRIEREARFASDVSHELRTPLTALATAIEVVKSRKNEMPERAGMAVDLLGAQVDYFERLVLDLLEISRLDAGAEQTNAEDVDVLTFLTVFTRSREGPTVTLESDGPWEVALDKRRAERVMSNLFENADRYAGGVTYLGLALLRRRIRHHGRRQRPGHPRGGSGSDLRALLAGSRGAPAHEQWHRSRALARVGARPAARSLDPTRYCSDRRCPLRGRAPGGAVAIMRRRAVVAALVVGVAAWGCAVPTQHDATRIDDGQVPFDLLEGSAVSAS